MKNACVPDMAKQNEQVGNLCFKAVLANVKLLFRIMGCHYQQEKTHYHHYQPWITLPMGRILGVTTLRVVAVHPEDSDAAAVTLKAKQDLAAESVERTQKAAGSRVPGPTGLVQWVLAKHL